MILSSSPSSHMTLSTQENEKALVEGLSDELKVFLVKRTTLPCRALRTQETPNAQCPPSNIH